MPVKNYENIDKEIEKKYKKRDKRKNIKMKVSGSSVKKLQSVIKR